VPNSTQCFSHSNNSRHPALLSATSVEVLSNDRHDRHGISSPPAGVAARTSSPGRGPAPEQGCLTARRLSSVLCRGNPKCERGRVTCRTPRRLCGRAADLAPQPVTPPAESRAQRSFDKSGNLPPDRAPSGSVSSGKRPHRSALPPTNTTHCARNHGCEDASYSTFHRFVGKPRE
jgi:hypothetical protein